MSLQDVTRYFQVFCQICVLK